MATLDLDVSDVDSEYSDRFLEDLSYSQSSSDEGSKSALVAQLQDSLVKNEPTSSSPAITTKKTKQTTKGKATTDLVYLGRTVRTPMKLTKSSTMDSSTESVGSTSKQSKQFSTSTDVRDACYSEWLSRKRSSISLDQDVKQKALEEKERKISLKKKEKEDRVKRALDKWNKSKTDELTKKTKERQELSKKKRGEEEEKQQKIVSSRVVSEKWREERTKELIKKKKEMEKKQKEEAEKKKEEAAEKAMDATHTFNAWKERKDTLTKEQRRKQLKEKRTLEDKDKHQKAERIDESKIAFDAWKSTKDDIFKTTKTLYTYKNQPQIHTQAWCPARNMKYGYPKDPAAAKKSTKKSKKTLSKSPSVESYTSASFESSDPGSSHGDSDDKSSVYSEFASDEVITALTGKRKTIQVCCQTLEYWCTCDSS